jgi:stress response protein YsnF
MFPCPVCDVKLNSAEQRRAHCRGKNHIKREEARKKAQELGTDFDSTPDHCDVCNVPLTSKMTAIDHFKGKMHQKKVKAVEEQRQGFKNYCEICEVRLQSLKVSEAHFNGKQHHKRERKTNAGKGQSRKISIDRKSINSRTSRPRTEDFSPSQNIFGDVFEETAKNSSSWENLNCDNDTEPKDLLSEFRSIRKYKPTRLKFACPNEPYQLLFSPCFSKLFFNDIRSKTKVSSPAECTVFVPKCLRSI